MFKKSEGMLGTAIAMIVALSGRSAQATLTLDLQDTVVDMSLVSFPYTFNYSIVAASTAPDTGRLTNSFDSAVSFSPAPSGIDVIGISIGLPGFVATPSTPVPGPLPPSVVVIGSNNGTPAQLPAGPFNILTYTLRVNSAPASGTLYATSWSGVDVREAGTNAAIPTSLVGGSILFASAVPEPLTAAGVILLASRVLGRRVRLSL